MQRLNYLILTILMTVGFFTQVQAQNSDRFRTWKTLEDITYDKTTDEYGEIYVPVFGEKVKALEGGKVTLPGYIIPFEGMFKPDHIIISSLPIASCFFCGSGGPETVAEVELSSPVKYTAKLIEVTGTLVLNRSNTDQLMYILKDATVTID